MTRWVFYHCPIAVNQCCLSYLPSSLSCCKQNCLDSNPWLSDDQVSGLPLCYCGWPMPFVFLQFSFSLCKQNCLAYNPWPSDDQMSVLPLCYCHWPMLFILFAVFSLPMQVKSLNSIEPLTLGWLSECSTTVLLPPTNVVYLICYLLSTAAIKIVWTLTLDLWMIKWVFYHCSTCRWPILSILLAIFSLLLQVKSMDSNLWP